MPWCMRYRDKVYCKCEMKDMLPPIDFVLGDEKRQLKFQVEGKHYLIELGTRNIERPQCGVQVGTLEDYDGVLLGLPFFSAYNIAFDLDTSSFGLLGEITTLMSQDFMLKSPVAAAKPVEEISLKEIIIIVLAVFLGITISLGMSLLFRYCSDKDEDNEKKYRPTQPAS